jgi:tRNA uridine 5-carbamoylmethylation protein Kti12
MIIVIIMRGPPGSGKSYFAENCATPLDFQGRVNIFSADYFFMRNGVYKWDAKLISKAHELCKEGFSETLHNPGPGDNLVVVDNTNTTAKEIRFYYEMAMKFADSVQIIEIGPPPGEENWVEACAKRNQHGVPLESIQRMQDRIQIPLPEVWNRILVERHDGYFIRKDEAEDVCIEVR